MIPFYSRSSTVSQSLAEALKEKGMTVEPSGRPNAEAWKQLRGFKIVAAGTVRDHRNNWIVAETDKEIEIRSAGFRLYYKAHIIGINNVPGWSYFQIVPADFEEVAYCLDPPGFKDLLLAGGNLKEFLAEYTERFSSVMRQLIAMPAPGWSLFDGLTYRHDDRGFSERARNIYEKGIYKGTAYGILNAFATCYDMRPERRGKETRPLEIASEGRTVKTECLRRLMQKEEEHA